VRTATCAGARAGRVEALASGPGECRLPLERVRAKFACIGCSGNAPDPAKRKQVLRKQAWAEARAAYAQTQGLLAEERQLREIVESCRLILDEMDLIEAARSDSQGLVTITGADQQ
jgi:hypothetical protein